jgi:peptidoglycan/LPS O-acetylase OafA/YrhL
MSTDKEEKLEKRIYLPGLDGLRFFAAFSVIIGHIELLKYQLSIPSNYEFTERANFGGLGVYFFFVLSGFLITYLLFKEKSKNGFIAIKQFYIRRILRIWPLYYLVMILSLFVLPQFEMMQIPYLHQFYDVNFSSNLILFLIMLPNVALAFMPAVAHGGQLWSIGVEEQFYLVWPGLFNKSKKIVRLIVVGFFSILAVKAIYLFLMSNGLIPVNEWTAGIKKVIGMSKFECMLVGAFGAYLVIEKKGKVLQVIYSFPIQIITLLSIPFLNYYFPDSLNDLVHLPYAFLFLVLILNVSTNPKSIIKLENKVFNFLGRISYGLYMYHMLVIVFLIQVERNWMMQDSLSFNVLLYISAIGASVLVAWVSYNYFEKPFLRIKEKFTIVRSGKI